MTEIWQLNQEGDPELVGTVDFVDGFVELDVPEEFEDLVIQMPVFDGERTLTHKDGKEWVDRLPEGLRGTYVWAQQA